MKVEKLKGHLDLLLLSVLLSEVARFVLQLVYYRRGLAS